VRRALALVLLAAAPAAGGGVLPVVTTSTDLKSLVEAVGGDAVRVESLAAPGHDPHALQLKPGQLARLRSGALLVRIGLDHEPWLTRALQALGDPRFGRGSPHALDVSRGIALVDTEAPRVRDERGAHLHGFGNPHYWLDPENARPMTQAILDALVRLAPDARDRFQANRARFLERLDAGLARWSAALAPHRGTRVVVVHDTWPYFARRFGLVVVAALEPTPGVAPSASTVATVTRRMREAGVRLVVAEPSSNAALAAQVAARGGATVVTLAPSVGAEPEAADYLALFDVNVARLARALAGSR
jgi:ABC-type Zn uptake system ZnuABC Zn-binding protein ZnuA